MIRSLRLILDQRSHVVSSQLLAAGEEFELHHEHKPNDCSAELLHQIDNRARGAAGSEKIVGDDHAMTVANRVAMDLQSVLTILEIVRDLRTLSRQLASACAPEQIRRQGDTQAPAQK